MSKRYVILGNGIAGITAAETIRKLQPDARIIMFTEEQGPTYIRPLLSKTLLKTLRKDNMAVHPAEWYTQQGIVQIFGKRVVELDAKHHKLKLSDGSFTDYDKLIYTLGAKPFVPALENMPAKGICTVRTMDDIYGLHNYAVAAKNIIVVGAGVIGMEIAAELQKLCPSVSFVELADRVMMRQLDEESSAYLKAKLEEKNIAVYTGVKIEALQSNANGRVCKATLSDGKELAADLVVFTAGLVPVKDVAEKAGLECGRGVKVSRFMQTSDPDIFAAGDCVEGPFVNPALWTFAKESGEIAGHNACLDAPDKAMGPADSSIMVSTMGIDLFAAGITSGEGIEAVKSLAPAENKLFKVNKKANKESYEKRFYKNGALCGAVLIGDLSSMALIKQELNEKEAK